MQLTRLLVLCLLMAAHGSLAEARTRFSAGEPWDWQLTAPLDLTRKVNVYDLHPGLVTQKAIDRLRARGVKTICYVSVGTLEKTAPDRKAFPAKVIGKVYGDWPDEKFLDIRQRDILLPLMKKRFEVCKAKGFQAIEPDNMDVHYADSGFPITKAHTKSYVLALAKIAHSLGLAIGQKNVPDMTGHFVNVLDFAITESCHQDGWCGDVAVYSKKGKAIFDAEYTDRKIDFSAACRAAKSTRISMILKNRDLTKDVKFCPN